MITWDGDDIEKEWTHGTNVMIVIVIEIAAEEIIATEIVTEIAIEIETVATGIEIVRDVTVENQDGDQIIRISKKEIDYPTGTLLNMVLKTLLEKDGPKVFKIIKMISCQ